MTTLTAAPPTAAPDRPAVTELTLLVGTVTMGHLRSQTSAPVALDDEEFVATLGTPSPGAPSHVIGRRAAGRAYDRITLEYRSGGRTHRRTWALDVDHGSEARYQLLEDTGARGGFAVLDR